MARIYLLQRIRTNGLILNEIVLVDVLRSEFVINLLRL